MLGISSSLNCPSIDGLSIGSWKGGRGDMSYNEAQVKTIYLIPLKDDRPTTRYAADISTMVWHSVSFSI